MNLPELSIKRHVFAWMLSAVIVLFGIISYQRIGIDRIPSIDFPIIMINTTLKGANPDVVDSSITGIIETAINTTPGIEHIQSSSSPGVSTITITFALNKNIDVARFCPLSQTAAIATMLVQNITEVQFSQIITIYHTHFLQHNCCQP